MVNQDFYTHGKYPSKMKEKLRLSDKQTEFIACRLTLQEMLKETRQAKWKNNKQWLESAEERTTVKVISSVNVKAIELKALEDTFI